MAKKKLCLEDNSKLPKPKLTWIDGKPFVSNGWIRGSYFEIIEQPSIRSVEYANEVFADNAHRNKDIYILGRKRYVNSKRKNNFRDNINSYSPIFKSLLYD